MTGKHALPDGKPRKTVNEIVARPTRTAMQASPAYLVVWLVDEQFYHLKPPVFAIAVVLLTLVFNFAQVLLENAGLLTPIMRDVPPTKVSVVDDTPPTGAEVVAKIRAQRETP